MDHTESNSEFSSGYSRAPESVSGELINDQISNRLDQVIENVQVIILSAELLKDELRSEPDSKVAMLDMTDQIIRIADDNTKLVAESGKKSKRWADDGVKVTRKWRQELITLEIFLRRQVNTAGFLALRLFHEKFKRLSQKT